MTSQISFSRLIRENMKRRGWMLILNAVIQIIIGPIVMIMNITSYRDRGYIREIDSRFYMLRDTFRVEYGIILSLVVLAFGIIFSVCGFSHFFSKQKTDLYGSLPVKREKQFTVNYINSVIIWTIPFLLAVAITTVISAIFIANAPGGESYVGQVVMLGVEAFRDGMLSFMAIYSVSLIATMIAGRGFPALMAAASLGFVLYLVYGELTELRAHYLMTYLEGTGGENIWDDMTWISPMITPFRFTYVRFENTHTSHTLLFAGTILVIILNSVIALLLMKRRPAELAENGITNKPFSYGIRIVTSFSAGIGGAIFMSVFTTAKIWNYFGIVLGVIASFGILNMIFNCSGRSFFKDKFVMLGVLAATLLCFTAFAYDLFGYDTYLPKADSIRSAELYFDRQTDDSVRLHIDENGKNRYLMGADILGKFETTNTAQVWKLIENGAVDAHRRVHNAGTFANSMLGNYDYEKDYRLSEDFLDIMYVKVNLNNGGSYYRKYYLSKAVADEVYDIIRTKEYREAYFPLYSGLVDSNRLEIDSYNVGLLKTTNYNIDIDNQEIIDLIIKIYSKDFYERIDGGFKKYNETEDIGSIILSYSGENEFSNSFYMRYYMNIHDCDLRTIAASKYLLDNAGPSNASDDEIKQMLTEIFEMDL